MFVSNNVIELFFVCFIASYITNKEKRENVASNNLCCDMIVAYIRFMRRE